MVALTDEKSVSDLIVTALVIYDGKLLSDNKIFDWTCILVEGNVSSHHTMRLKVMLETHERTKYKDISQRYVEQEQIVYNALKEWGYRVIRKSIVHNIDYTDSIFL
jgi:hypothetical protein